MKFTSKNLTDTIKRLNAMTLKSKKLKAMKTISFTTDIVWSKTLNQLLEKYFKNRKQEFVVYTDNRFTNKVYMKDLTVFHPIRTQYFELLKKDWLKVIPKTWDEMRKNDMPVIDYKF